MEMRFNWNPDTGRVVLCMGGHGLHGMPHPIVCMGHAFAGKWNKVPPEHDGPMRLLQWLSPCHTLRNGKRTRECYEETKICGQLRALCNHLNRQLQSTAV